MYYVVIILSYYNQPYMDDDDDDDWARPADTKLATKLKNGASGR